MKRFAVIAIATTFFAAPAFADEKVTEDEGKKIEAAIAEWGCSGGKFEKESEATGVYEVDDAKCKGGQYDFRLGKDFKVMVITND
jgi:hypothetical protein